VLVDGAGASKLTDFGIAARAGEAVVAAGTLAYAPPEQFGGGPATPSGDVYAATATFYECLTGRPPFRGDSAEQLLYQHLAEPVPLEPVPEPLRPLIQAGMAKDPAHRPADATALVTELRTVAGRAYGPDWEERGRSRLGEAALLLAALWPSGGPAAVQGTAVHRIWLRRHLPHPRISMAKAMILAGVVIAAAAAGTAVAVSHRSSGPAAAAPVPQPVLYNYDFASGGWTSPQVKPAGWLLFIDGRAFLTGMHWARWTGTTAVTSSATWYERDGSGFTKADEHYYKVTVTLSDVRPSGGPRPGPYFTRMVITGHGLRTLTYTYEVSRVGSLVIAAWEGGVVPPATPAPTSAAAPPPTSAAAPPPTQVNLQGVTIGIGAVNTDPDAMDVAATLAAYFGGIDARNYEQAWDTYTSALQAVVSFQRFSSELSTSQDTQIVVLSIRHDSNGDLDVQVGFQSHQAGQYGPDPGQTCTNWSLDYHLVASSGAQPSAGASPSYLISKVTDVGAGHASC
jgi:hypothetical protein